MQYQCSNTTRPWSQAGQHRDAAHDGVGRLGGRRGQGGVERGDPCKGSRGGEGRIGGGGPGAGAGQAATTACAAEHRAQAAHLQAGQVVWVQLVRSGARTSPLVFAPRPSRRSHIEVRARLAPLRRWPPTRERQDGQHAALPGQRYVCVQPVPHHRRAAGRQPQALAKEGKQPGAALSHVDLGAGGWVVGWMGGER